MQRAVILISAAQQQLAKRSAADPVKDSRDLRPFEYLADAEKLLNKSGESADVTRARLGLVAALARLDLGRALNVLGEVVVTINKIDAFDAADTNAPLVAGLDVFSAQLLLPRIKVGFGMKDALEPLAKVDFDGTLYAINALSAPAVRGFCRLEIAEAALRPKTVRF